MDFVLYLALVLIAAGLFSIAGAISGMTDYLRQRDVREARDKWLDS